MADELDELDPGVALDIAELLGRSPDEVAELRRELGHPDLRFYPGRRRVIPEAEREAFCKLALTRTDEQLADHYGLHPRTIARYRDRWTATTPLPEAKRSAPVYPNQRCRCGRLYVGSLTRCPSCGLLAGR